jgi:glycosyltransferase involved in cell wall biosynthesis
MRVLTIVDDLGRGGTQRVAVETACFYQNAGFINAILTRKGSGLRASDAQAQGIELFIADDPATAHTSDAARAARDWKPDLIVAHRQGLPDQDYGNLLRAVGAGQPNGPRVLEHSHFGRPDHTQDRLLFDAHIQISRWCHWKWTRWTSKIKPRPIGVCVPHMVDLSRFSPATKEETDAFRNEHNIPLDAFLYGYVAQKHPGKWSANLFNSFKAQAEKDPNTRLVIAGIGEYDKRLFMDFPANIKDRIIVIPFINGDEALQTAYSAMDTFVLATDIGETFGLVAAEAMSCGTPVVTMANPQKGSGQCEVVGHESGGLIAASPAAVPIAMQRIREDHDLRAKCAANARQRVIDRYNPETIGAKLIQVLKIVRSAPDRNSIREALASDASIITSTNVTELHQDWGGMIGEFTFKQRLTQLLILNPTFQRYWVNRTLKRLASAVPSVRKTNQAQRILTILNDLGPGGTQRAAENNAIAFKQAGRDSAVLVLNALGTRAQRIQDAGVEVLSADNDDAIAQHIADWKPDLIHFHRKGQHDPRSSALLRAASRKLGYRIPTVELNHFGRCNRSPDRKLFDVHAQLSRECLRRWTQWARGLKPQPISVVLPHFIDTDRFTPATDQQVSEFRTQHNIPQDAFVFFRVGQPNPAKWTAGLINAFKSVSKQLDNAYLVVVGPPQTILDAINTLDPSTRDKVIVIDFLQGDDALRACYSACDLFVHTATVGESFGLVLAESMACSTPCLTVSTPTSDNSQGSVVGHNDAGIVLASERLLAPWMIRLATDRSQTETLTSRARPRVLEHFSKDRIVQDTLDLFDMVTQRAGDTEALRAEIIKHPRLVPSQSQLTKHEPIEGSHSMINTIIAHVKERPTIYSTFSAIKKWIRARR